MIRVSSGDWSVRLFKMCLASAIVMVRSLMVRPAFFVCVRVCFSCFCSTSVYVLIIFYTSNGREGWTKIAHAITYKRLCLQLSPPAVKRIIYGIQYTDGTNKQALFFLDILNNFERCSRNFSR